MSILAEFDPLNSPHHAGQSPVAAAAGGAEAKSHSAAKAPSQKRFEGVSLPFLYSSKWHSLKSSNACLSFRAPQAAAAAQEEDAVAKLQREKEEKEKKEKEEREQRERAEQKRQEEAKAALAAGKEPIQADTTPVLLPEPEPAGKLTPTPLDPDLAKAQAEQERAVQHEQAERNRFAGKPTFRYWITGDVTAGQEQPAIVKEWQGAFTLDNLTLKLTDVIRKENQAGQEASTTEVQGSYTLTITEDGKRLTGSIEQEEIEFELMDESDPGKTLEMLLGF